MHTIQVKAAQPFKALMVMGGRSRGMCMTNWRDRLCPATRSYCCPGFAGSGVCARARHGRRQPPRAATRAGGRCAKPRRRDPAAGVDSGQGPGRRGGRGRTSRKGVALCPPARR
eukprot:171490-Chlamydomonas_euryale.AAC.1